MDHISPTWRSNLSDGRTANLVMTDRAHGDMSIGQAPAIVDAARRAVVDAPWSWLTQVHETDVFVVDSPGAGAGRSGDALVTTIDGAAISIAVADCAPVALVASSGALGIAHAGWRGLLDGVIAATAATMAKLGHLPTAAVVGPCIGPGHYEFGAAELELMTSAFGGSVASRTIEGRPALDMVAAVDSALSGIGVTQVDHLGGCTATNSNRFWSHRARGDVGRQVLVGWIER